MSDGRTIWWAKDAAWWRRELIVALGEEFGADGPAVIDWLSAEAKTQNEGGVVKAGYRTIARGCFVDADRVREIVSRSVTLSLLDDFAELEHRFTCRMSGWQRDQERGNAAFRKARSRSREPKSGDVSRPVTVGHAESHTGENSTSSSSARARDERPEWVADLATARDLLNEVAGRTDVEEVGLSNLRERFPSRPFLQTIRGAAEWLALPANADRPTLMTLHRFFEREPEAARPRRLPGDDTDERLAAAEL